MTFQERAKNWAVICFGKAIATNRTERSYRFFEEVLELVQAAGLTRCEATELVEYVYNRPKGELKQEAGGVLVTLAVLCDAHGISMDEAAHGELSRCWDNLEKIRTKQLEKSMRVETDTL